MQSIKRLNLFSDYIKYKLINPSLTKLVSLPRNYGINISSPLGATRPPRGFGIKKNENDNNDEESVKDSKKEDQSSTTNENKKEYASTDTENKNDNNNDTNKSDNGESKNSKKPSEDGEKWYSKKSSKNTSSNNKDDKEPDFEFSSGMFRNAILVFAAIGGFAFFSSYIFWSGMGSETTFQEFCRNFLQERKVKGIEIVNNNTYVKAYTTTGNVYFKIGSVDSFERQFLLAQYDMNYTNEELIPIRYSNVSDVGPTIVSFAGALLPTALIIGFFLMMSRGMGKMGGGNPFSVGKSKHVKYDQNSKNKVYFKDVAGLEEAKAEIMEFVEFLKNPDRFTKLGAKIPKGALLVGPPGTGKTLLAKATAGESNVPFFSISGSDFLEMFVGVGPARVRDLFAEARKNAPCIVFIDEIDAVGRARGKGQQGGHDERENTLNQMLVEMDGFSSRDGVVILAGTNRADILDAALLRPGRFDRQVFVDRPDILGREQIFMVHLAKLKLKDDPKVISQRIAALTPGMVGADIANICNEAAICAARLNKDSVELSDFEKAIDRVIGGLEKKNKVITPEEKRVIAHHEAGHAVAGWFLEHADPLLKVTIIPRSNALGFAQYLPKELMLYSPEQFFDRMCMALAGRAAEQVFFSRVTTGAADDLKKVTGMAYAQVAQYGFNSKLGNLSYNNEDSGQSFQKPYSDATAQLIDEEARNLVRKCWEVTLKLVTDKKKEVSLLAEKLLVAENLNFDDVVALIGRRPFAYQGIGADFLNASHTAKVDVKPTIEPTIAEEKVNIHELSSRPL